MPDAKTINHYRCPEGHKFTSTSEPFGSVTYDTGEVYAIAEPVCMMCYVKWMADRFPAIKLDQPPPKKSTGVEL